MKVAAVLLAAGRGERLGFHVPKAFVELDGRPLLLHSFDVVRDSVAAADIVVTVPASWEARTSALVGDDARVVTGGGTRQRSVAAALEAVMEGGEPDVIVCHDVARPFASAALYEAVIAVLESDVGADGAIPVIPIVDTLKRVDGGHVVETIPRDGIVRVQTPQAFRFAWLARAHREAGPPKDPATDDASLLERIGRRVATVEGETDNIKITTEEDLRLATSIGRSRG